MSEYKKNFNKDNPYIFVSYKSENRAVVKRCVEYLVENYNMNIWYDVNLHAGLNWNKEALPKLRDPDCKAVILFASAEALTSKNIEEELKLAKWYEKPIIPINFVSQSFEQTLRSVILKKYNKESPDLVDIAESIVSKYLDKNLTYLTLDLDNESFYDELVRSIDRNAGLKMSDKKSKLIKARSDRPVSKEKLNISISTEEGKKTVAQTKVFPENKNLEPSLLFDERDQYQIEKVRRRSELWFKKKDGYPYKFIMGYYLLEKENKPVTKKIWLNAFLIYIELITMFFLLILIS